jgi:hypothetical protein
MHYTSDIKENFSAHLRTSLKAQYKGRLPSAAILARDFNLRAYEASPISGESARRWMRGICLPEEDRLRVLVNWLNLDFNRVLALPSVRRQSDSYVFSKDLSPGERDKIPNRTEAPHSSITPNGHSAVELELISLIMNLPAQKQELLKDFIQSSLTTNRPD